MPQIFQVLKCYKCFVFQVHQRKKSFKWECKLCGEKQSLKRNYGLGTAKECRIHVQKLNIIKGEMDDTKVMVETDEEEEDNESFNFFSNKRVKAKSKWENYVEESDETACIDSTNATIHCEDATVVLELPKKQRRKFCTPVKNVLETIKTTQKCNKENLTYLPETELCSTICQEINKPISLVTHNSSDLSDTLGHTKPKILAKRVLEKAEQYMPSIVDKSSKWAQYIAIPGTSEEVDKKLCFPGTSSEKNIFSLCDDEDIDDILDI